jgi:hypothetical protein
MTKAHVSLALLATGLTSVVIAFLLHLAPTAIADVEHTRRVVIRDDCDPNDATWNPVGGCVQPRGDVTRAEFGAQLISPNARSVVGHQAWRNDPTYVEINANAFLIAKNAGGRVHTFTKVTQFGGGRGGNPLLNQGLDRAPECVTPAGMMPDDIAPGEHVVVHGLTPGNHHFQCCLHPWMRTTVKVHEH